MSDATIDQQFIEYIVKSLVGNPDDVIVDRKIDEKGVLLTLTVNPEDLGRVIGKRGATAQSLRTLLRALGTKQEARFNLKIFDNGEPRPERTETPPRNEDRRVDSVESEKPKDEQPAEESESETSEPEKKNAPVEGGWNSGSSDNDSSAARDAANDSGEEMSAIEKTRKELEDLDDLDI